jgi:hypothetical protein
VQHTDVQAFGGRSRYAPELDNPAGMIIGSDDDMAPVEEVVDAKKKKKRRKDEDDDDEDEEEVKPVDNEMQRLMEQYKHKPNTGAHTLVAANKHAQMMRKQDQHTSAADHASMRHLNPRTKVNMRVVMAAEEELGDGPSIHRSPAHQQQQEEEQYHQSHSDEETDERWNGIDDGHGGGMNEDIEVLQAPPAFQLKHQQQHGHHSNRSNRANSDEYPHQQHPSPPHHSEHAQHLPGQMMSMDESHDSHDFDVAPMNHRSSNHQLDITSMTTSLGQGDSSSSIDSQQITPLPQQRQINTALFPSNSSHRTPQAVGGGGGAEAEKDEFDF